MVVRVVNNDGSFAGSCWASANIRQSLGKAAGLPVMIFTDEDKFRHQNGLAALIIEDHLEGDTELWKKLSAVADDWAVGRQIRLRKLGVKLMEDVSKVGRFQWLDRFSISSGRQGACQSEDPVVDGKEKDVLVA